VSEQTQPRSAGFGAWSTLLALAVVCFVLSLAFHSGERARGPLTPTDSAMCEIARPWRAKHGGGADLQVVVSDIVFRNTPGDYVVGEGVVVAPVAVDVPSAQAVVDIQTIPPASRMYDVDGVRVVAWPYPGLVHKEMRFTAVSLVRRAPARPAGDLGKPTFEQLGERARIDARFTAAEIEERHQLAACKAFPAWVKETAGEPPYTEQLLRISKRLEKGLARGAPSKRRTEDVCAALRDDAFSSHQAHVLAVMAMRELGAPAYGFVAADLHYLVGVWVDGPGWVTLDLAKPGEGYQIGGRALVTKGPLVGEFEASTDGFWMPAAADFEKVGTNIGPRSWTRWSASESTNDTTVTYAVAFDEVCR
jgi:hypothetical protein